MKSKNNTVIRELTTQELIERIDEEKRQLLKLKMSHAVSPIENPMKLRMFRKNIARMKTELQRRKLQEKQEKK